MRSYLSARFVFVVANTEQEPNKVFSEMSDEGELSENILTEFGHPSDGVVEKNGGIPLHTQRSLQQQQQCHDDDVQHE